MKRKSKLALALSTVAFSCCVVASGLAIGNTLKTQAADTPFVGFEYDFKDDSIKSNLTAKVGAVSTWTVDTTGDGYYKNGTSSWAELYLTGNEIPMSTGNQMTVIEIDYTYEATNGEHLNIGIISKDSYNGESLTDSLNFGINLSSKATVLRKGKVGNFTSATWLATNYSVASGEHTLTITLRNGNAAFMVDGKVLSSSKTGCTFDTNAVTGDSFYLDFCIPSGPFAFDNIKVYQEIVDPEADEIRTSSKSFDGLEEKALATVNTDMLTVASKRMLLGNVPDLTGTKYFALTAKNTAGAETGLAIELTQGKNTGNYGHWWTAGEYLPYYLLDSTGVQEGYLLPYESTYSNRAYARVPADFDGKVIIPVNSFEVMTWSANSSKVSEHTQDANAMDLTNIGWFDIYGKPLTATGTGLTVSTLSVLGEDFADVASATVANAERAIAQIGAVTLASESQIAYARARYDGLSEGDKASVSNLATLTAAEATLGELKNASSALVTNGKDFTGTEGVAFSEPFASAPVTLSAWIKVGREISDNTHVGTVVGNMARGQIGSYVFDANNTFSMEVTTNGNPKFEWRVSRTNKVSFVVENVDVRTGSWVHLAFVRNVAARQIECYVNGTLVGVQGGLRKDFIDEIAMIKPAIIGSDYTNDDVIARGYTPDFNGSIANVRVYDTLLDESALALDLADNYSKANLLGGVDFMSGEANEYYNKAGANAVDYFGWKAIDESELWASEGEYTIALQGDTQMYLSMAKDGNGNTIYVKDSAEINPDYDKTSNLMYKNNTWLVNNKDNLNLQFLTHVGDLTDFMNYDAWVTKGVAEMNLGLEYMDILTAGGVEWSMARGNHDGGDTADRLAAWDGAYSYAKYGTNVDGYQGSEANMRNVYYTFTAGETEYMVFVLDYEPDTVALEWAKEVIDANQDKQVIITTHVFMNSKGELITSKMSGENSGKDIWDKLVSKCPNIVMVLCGHSDPVDIVRQPLVNDYGNTVWSVVVDESTLNYSGNRQVGVLALMKFTADGKNVSFSFYSPSEGKLFRSINQFAIELDLSFFESKDNVVELDFSNDSHGSYFTAPANANGNFVVQNDALYPVKGYALGVYNKEISTKGTYQISLNFNVGTSIRFYVGLVEDIQKESTTANICYGAYDLKGNAIYNDRLAMAGWVNGISTNYADGKTHTMKITIVNGVVTFTIDETEIGTYRQMVALEKMYLGFHSADTTAYVDNLKVEYTPAEVDGKVIYDNYGDVALTTDGYFSGALPTLTKSGHVFVGYSIDGALYPAGYVLDTAEGKAVIAVFTKYAMVNGGSVKAVSGAYGIRFSAYVDNESKSYLTGAKFGSIMAHTDEFTDGFEYSKMTMENLSAYDMRSMEAVNFVTSDKYTYFHTVIDNVKDVTREFACRGYVTVTYADGSSKTFYATVSDNRRTIKQIAQRAYDDIATVKNGDYCNEVSGGYSILTQAQRNTLANIINK